MDNGSSPTPNTQHPTPLIINGDDFGYSDAVNRAIIEAHRTGVLTSASLMVNERAASGAVQLAKENPNLAVGLHLVLVLGRAEAEGLFQVSDGALPVTSAVTRDPESAPSHRRFRGWYW